MWDEYPESPDDFYTGSRKDPSNPRLHQIEAIDVVEEGLKDADKGQLLMACGTGKTYFLMDQVETKSPLNIDSFAIIETSFSNS